jgi:hypothetical protein
VQRPAGADSVLLSDGGGGAVTGPGWSTWSTAPRPTLVEGYADGGYLHVNVDGVDSYSTLYGSRTTGTGGAALGAAPWSHSQFWQGRIGEVIVLDTWLTAAQRRSVQEYRARKWGLTIAPAAPTVTTTPRRSPGTPRRPRREGPAPRAEGAPRHARSPGCPAATPSR